MTREAMGSEGFLEGWLKVFLIGMPNLKQLLVKFAA